MVDLEQDISFPIKYINSYEIPRTIFNGRGTHIISFGTMGSQAGQFTHPCGVAIGRNGNIFVSDSANCRIQIFTAQGDFINQFGTSGKSNGQLDFPNGITIDKRGNLIIADDNNKRISIFSSEGIFIKTITFPEEDQYKIFDVAINQQGNIAAVFSIQF